MMTGRFLEVGARVKAVALVSLSSDKKKTELENYLEVFVN